MLAPWWILAQHGVPTPVGTGSPAQLQLLPHQVRAILTKHHCDQQGPLVVTYNDIHRHPAGKVDALRLLGATITIVYIIPTQMKVMAQCRAHHHPFLFDPQWPSRCILQAYLRTCAKKAGRTTPRTKDIAVAYKALQHQHPRPRPNEQEDPNIGDTKREEPTLSGKGWAPASILLLAPNGHKHATRTVQRHHSPWSMYPNTTPWKPMCHLSDTMTKAYRAPAGTAVRRPSTPHGPYCTSSPPNTRPPPRQQPWTSRHGSPPGFTQYPQAAQHM